LNGASIRTEKGEKIEASFVETPRDTNIRREDVSKRGG